MTFKCAVRVAPLTKIGRGKGGIQSAEDHAKRLDPVSRKRVVRQSEPLAYVMLPSLDENDLDGLDYVAAFKEYKRQVGASERKGAALGLEFKIVVSPEWLLEEGGDPHDPYNTRVDKLIYEAIFWAEDWGGEDSVWAVRYDTDERGAGVVDLFMSPVRMQKHKSGKSKAVISVRKAKEELLAAERKHDPTLKTSGAAMQSSWARWCQQHLDPRIQRGESKAKTNREHVHAEVYAKAAQEARQQAQSDLEAEKAGIIAEARHRAALALAEAEQEAMDRAERIISAAEQEAERLIRDEVSARSATINRAWGVLHELTKAGIRAVFGNEGYDQVRDWVNARWLKHPDNPRRPVERDPDWYQSSGPSP